MYKIISTDSLQHSWAGSDKKYSAEEKAKEKKYNHEYYMKNKEKWGVKKQDYTKGDSDFDDSNRDEKNRIGNSEFFAFKNKDGRWVITEEDMKWVLPEGVEVDAEMRKQLEAFKGFQDPNIKNGDDWDEAVNSIINKGKKESGSGEFDIDAAAKDIIRGKYGNGQERKDELGDDYEAVQKRVNELMKEMGSTGSKSSSSKSTEAAKDLKDRGYSSSMDGYNATKKKTVKHSYTVVSSDDELYHHGILGQKWGVRRFQNSDGSLTTAGRQRYSTGQKSGLSKEEMDKLVRESENIANNVDKTNQNLNKIKKNKKAQEKEKQKEEKFKNVEDMSNEELEAFFRRYDMEQRYDKIVNEHKKDMLDGGEVVKEVLDVVKETAAIAVSAATIYSILKNMK